MSTDPLSLAEEFALALRAAQQQLAQALLQIPGTALFHGTPYRPLSDGRWLSIGMMTYGKARLYVGKPEATCYDHVY